MQEFIESTPVLCDIRTCQIDNRIQQCHGFGKNRGDILPALRRHFGQARVSADVDFQGTANDIHLVKIVAATRPVERAITWAGFPGGPAYRWRSWRTRPVLIEGLRGAGCFDG